MFCNFLGKFHFLECTTTISKWSFGNCWCISPRLSIKPFWECDFDISIWGQLFSPPTDWRIPFSGHVPSPRCRGSLKTEEKITSASYCIPKIMANDGNISWLHPTKYESLFEVDLKGTIQTRLQFVWLWKFQQKFSLENLKFVSEIASKLNEETWRKEKKNGFARYDCWTSISFCPVSIILKLL